MYQEHEVSFKTHLIYLYCLESMNISVFDYRCVYWMFNMQNLLYWSFKGVIFLLFLKLSFSFFGCLTLHVHVSSFLDWQSVVPGVFPACC